MSESNVPAAPAAPVAAEPNSPAVSTGNTPVTPEGTSNKEIAQEVMRRFKVKVDGKDVDVDEKELLRGYSHQRAASKVLQEGQQARKQAEEFIALMRDPEKAFEVLEKLGHNPRELAERRLARALEDELMDPRDRDLRDTKAKLKAIEDMEAQQKKAIEERRNAMMKAKYTQEYETQFVEALKVSNLPATKPMVAEMAKYISRSADLGYKMSPDEAAKLVREDIQKAHMNLLGSADGDTLIKLLGEEVANKVRNWDVARLKNPTANSVTPPQDHDREPRSQRNSKNRMTASEWKAFNRGIKK